MSLGATRWNEPQTHTFILYNYTERQNQQTTIFKYKGRSAQPLIYYITSLRLKHLLKGEMIFKRFLVIFFHDYVLFVFFPG